MSEYDSEPVRGLPGHLPDGERILWQGAPEWKMLARTAFHTRLIAGYFVALTAISFAFARADGDYTGVAMTVALGVVGVALLHLLAWGSARSTIYTLTNRRIVLRVGMAVPKCVNLPLGSIGAVGLAERADGTGDLPLTLTGSPKLGYLALWPHARAWQIVRPQPMLRAVPGAAELAALIARNCLAASPDGRIALPEARPVATSTFAAAQAA